MVFSYVLFIVNVQYSEYILFWSLSLENSNCSNNLFMIKLLVLLIKSTQLSLQARHESMKKSLKMWVLSKYLLKNSLKRQSIKDSGNDRNCEVKNRIKWRSLASHFSKKKRRILSDNKEWVSGRVGRRSRQPRGVRSGGPWGQWPP